MYKNTRTTGFIAIPILIAILIGTTVVAGAGGYYVATKMQDTEPEIVIPQEIEVDSNQDDITEVLVSTTTESKVEIPEEQEVINTQESPIPTQASDQQKTQEVFMSAPQPVDLCTNIVGLQTSIPSGYKVNSFNSCEKMVDRCSNVEGIQEEIPTNMQLTTKYGCITESDLADIESEIAAAKKAEEKEREAQEECNDAKDDLETVERAYNKAVDDLDDVSSEEVYSDAYMSAYEAFNKQKTKLNKAMIDAEVACGVYDFDESSVQTTIEIPSGPTYTNCYYYGQGNIQCTSY